MRHALAISTAVVSSLLVTAGCGLVPTRGERPPTPVRVRVTAAPRLNPDAEGASLPTAVRVYQLASAAKAATVELPDLLRDPAALLGDDLLGVTELVVAPDGHAEATIALEKNARALLVAAVVRRPAGTTWRELVELPRAGRGDDLAFALEDYRLERR